MHLLESKLIFLAENDNKEIELTRKSNHVVEINMFSCFPFYESFCNYHESKYISPVSATKKSKVIA